MDWGLGNPNTTAALIALMMVAIWAVAIFRPWGFWVALAGCTVLGGCLVHTFSRGGLVAAFFGLLPLLVFTPRPWPKSRLVAGVVAVWVMIAFAIFLNAHERYGQGVVKQDRSITNRLHLWKHAPQMIADAPSGWGLGNAAKSYMQWYQPQEDTESFRTFVNSHLELLIELGWPMRFLYLFGWVSVFLISLPSRQRPWFSVPFGIWLAFGVASVFSSVAESPWLWVLPVIAFVSSLLWRGLNREWPRPLLWITPVVSAAVICMVLWICGAGETPISGSANKVVLGTGEPEVWLVADEPALGGDRFAKSLRTALKEIATPRTIGVVWSISDLPSNLSNAAVVIAGGSPENAKDFGRILGSANRVDFISPGFYPEELGVSLTEHNVAIFFGEFSQSSFLPSWEDTGLVQRVAAAGDFLPDWPQLVLSAGVKE